MSDLAREIWRGGFQTFLIGAIVGMVLMFGAVIATGHFPALAKCGLP